MSTTDRVQKIGFGYEDTPGTDPIDNASDKYWEFGIRTQEFKDDFPLETKEWNLIYKADSRQASEQELVRKQIPGLGVGFLSVNGLMEYLVLNSSSTVGSVHTLTPAATGELQTFTVRAESTGGTVDKFMSAVNCKAFQFLGNLEFIQGFGFMANTLIYNGQRQTTPTHNAEHDGLQFPTENGAMGGTQVNTEFQKDTNFTFRWDVDGDDVSYDAELFQMNFMIQNAQRFSYLQNQPYPQRIREGLYRYGLNFSILRGPDQGEGVSSIYDDFLAQVDDSTLHKMIMKIYAGATNYKQYTWDKVSINIKGPIELGLEKKLWIVQGVPTTISIDVVDGLDKTAWYGE